MQITYCDCCGTQLTAENKAGRQQSYAMDITQDHPILPSKTISVEVNLTYGSDVGMTRVTQNNGDFCQTCLETIVINSMLQRQQEAAVDNEEDEDVEAEEEQEDDQEPSEEADEGEEESDEEAEQGDDLDSEGNVIEEGNKL